MFGEQKHGHPFSSLQFNWIKLGDQLLNIFIDLDNSLLRGLTVELLERNVLFPTVVTVHKKMTLALGFHVNKANVITSTKMAPRNLEQGHPKKVLWRPEPEKEQPMDGVGPQRGILPIRSTRARCRRYHAYSSLVAHASLMTSLSGAK